MLLIKLFNVLLVALIIATLIVMLRLTERARELQARVARLEENHARWVRRLDCLDAEMDEHLSIAAIGVKPEYRLAPKPISVAAAPLTVETELPATRHEEQLPPDIQAMLDDAVETGYIDALRWREFEDILGSVSRQHNKRIWQLLFSEIESGRLRLEIQ